MKYLNKKQIYIVGAAKCATTSIAKNLSESASIYLDKNKEPCFHARSHLLNLNKDCEMVKKSNFILDESTYLEVFNNIDQEYFIDASTCYLNYSKIVAESIKKYSHDIDNIFIIIILRNPYERMLSQYYQMKKNGVEEKKFMDALDAEDSRIKNLNHPFFQYLNYSLYYENVKTFLNNFKNVKIVNFEEYNKNQERVIIDLFSFLNIKNKKIKIDKIQYNKTGNGFRYDFLKRLMVSSQFKFLRNAVGIFFNKKNKSKIFMYIFNKSLKSKEDIMVKGKYIDIIDDDLKLTYSNLNIKFIKNWINEKN